MSTTVRHPGQEPRNGKKVEDWIDYSPTNSETGDGGESSTLRIVAP